MIQRFCKFRVHEFMDPEPSEEVRVFTDTSEEEIQKRCEEWADMMSREYSGGPTTFVAIMSKEEAKTWIDSLEDNNENIETMFRECYGTLES